MRLLPPLRLTGATILREGELRHRSVAIERGRISKGPLPAVDLSGHLILPGIIDLFALPPAAPHQPPHVLIRNAQARAAAAGVTTGWLAIDWSWDGSAGDPARARAILAGMERAGGPVDLRPALRIEASRPDSRDALLATLREYRPQLALLENRADRLLTLDPGDPVLAAEAAGIGMSPAELVRALRQDARNSQSIPRHLCRIAESLDDVRAVYGSIDDPDGDIRETYSILGAALAFCPQSHAAAAAGRAMGSPVFVTPQKTPLQDDLLRAGLVNGFVSRGHQPALAQRALQMAGPGLSALPRVWPLVSSRPAAVMGLVDRGTLDYGQRADLVIIQRETLTVEATISSGIVTYLSPGCAQRFQNSEAANACLPIAAE